MDYIINVGGMISGGNVSVSHVISRPRINTAGRKVT